MSKNVLSVHAVDHVHKSVRKHVQIRGVNLLNVAGKYNFSTFAGTGNNGFYFVWREVLCLGNVAQVDAAGPVLS